MKKKIALSKEDKKAWDEYIKNPSGIYDKDKTKSVKVGNKNRFKFDLHGFTLDEANNKVKELVIFCIEKNIKRFYLSPEKAITLQTCQIFMFQKILEN